MILGNISNKTAPVVAFNIDTILFNKSANNLTQKIKRLFTFDTAHFDYFNREVSSTAIGIINNVWKKNEVSIYLVTFSDYKDELEELLYEEDVYYTRLVKAEGIDWLRRRCMYNYAYYVDIDDRIISELSVNNAKHLSDIWKFVKV